MDKELDRNLISGLGYQMIDGMIGKAHTDAKARYSPIRIVPATRSALDYSGLEYTPRVLSGRLRSFALQLVAESDDAMAD